MSTLLTPLDVQCTKWAIIPLSVQNLSGQIMGREEYLAEGYAALL
jgi:hypothetical protein